MGGKRSSQYSKRGSEETSSYVTPTGIDQYQSEFGQNYQNLYNQYQALNNNPVQLQSAPLYSTGLDAITQNTLSKGLQGIKAEQATRGRQTANALSVAGSGNNSSLINVLNRQAAIAGAGASNQLYSTALEQQRQQDIARQAMVAQNNQILLAKRASEINQLTQGSSLLRTLIEMAQVARGEKKGSTRTYEESGQKSGSKSFL